MRKSDDYIMDQLIEQNAQLNVVVKDILELQRQKLDAMQKITSGIKKGSSYAERIHPDKHNALEIISRQQNSLRNGIRIIGRIKHYFDLLIHMEQASLAIHNKKSQDDLARMIDVTNLPIEKFEHEMERVRMLDNLFQIILNFELEKQKEYVKGFGVDSKKVEEEYFHQSEEYGSKLSEGEIVKVSELHGFCTDLHKMISKRKGKQIDNLTESDKAALEIMGEMGRIKIQNRLFFPLTAYKLLNRMVRANIKSKKLDKLVMFLIFFMFSRLKKYRRDLYFSQLRAAILTYNLLESKEIGGDRKIMVTGAALLANLHRLDFTAVELQKEAGQDDEPHIIKKYYQTVNKVFAEEFPQIESLLRLCRKTDSEKPMHAWMDDGARIIEMVYEFDKELQKCGFEKAKFEEVMGALIPRLRKKYSKMSGAEADIEYLVRHWHRLIPKSLTN
jgi:hypothetical protein